MNTYIFKTNTFMKPYNRKKWWISEDYISEMQIQAINVQEALLEYKDSIKEKVEISNNALKNKQEFFMDDEYGFSKQVGYVITGKTGFETEDYKYIEQYIDLWIEILTVIDTNFD